MSLRNRARRLQEKTGLSYQQALEKLRVFGKRPAELSRKTGWPLEVCDRYLVDGHAPIDVIEVRRPTREELIVEVCHTLRATANARAVVLSSDDGRILAHVGAADTERAVFLRSVTAGARLPPNVAKPAMPKLPDVWELDGDVVLAMSRVKQHALLVVKFHKSETSLGLVRLRMKKAEEELEALLADDEEIGPPPSGGRGGPGGVPAEVRVAKPAPPPKKKK
jgi:hypothetical protein